MTFRMTKEQLEQMIPKNPYIDEWFDALDEILPEYEINTPRRVAAFIAQTAHESGGFRHIKENLNYRAESLMRTWPRHFPTMEIAKQYERKPEMIANRAYANRMGNGDEASGDGWRYAGKGLIQLTGKSNYQAYANSLGISLEEAQKHLLTFEGCVQSACWFWEANKLNRFADAGDVKGLSRRINGGTIGLDDRIKKTEHANFVLGVE